jgi:hypothetical protein
MVHVANFKPGQSGNPNGRPPGSRNKRTAEIIAEIRKLGHKDCLMRLSEIVHSEPDTSLAIAASSALAPYMHSKMQSVPSPRYIDEPLQLPQATSIEQAIKNIAFISDLKATGKIDLDFADSLVADNRAILNALVEEQKLLLAQGGPAEQHITISGGLPPLPGCDGMIMPPINGHSIDAEVVAALDAPQTESQQSNPPAQENPNADP